MRLELGWYKDPGNGKLVHLRFFAEDVENPVAIYQLNNRLLEMNPRGFAKAYEFVSAEKPEIWVPADIDKITLRMLPMRARFRDNDEQPWEEGSLMGFCTGQYFVSNANPYFKIWSFCEVVQ